MLLFGLGVLVGVLAGIVGTVIFIVWKWWS